MLTSDIFLHAIAQELCACARKHSAHNRPEHEQHVSLHRDDAHLCLARVRAQALGSLQWREAGQMLQRLPSPRRWLSAPVRQALAAIVLVPTLEQYGCR